jgi:hypothetical protein
MSYLWPSQRPRPPGTSPPQWGPPMRPVPRSDGRPRMARRPLRWPATHAPAPAGPADRFADGGCRQVLDGNRPAPTSSRSALAGSLQATDQHSQAAAPALPATGQHSRQPASAQGNRAALATIGPVLPGLGPEFVIFIFLLARRQAWAYRGREAAGRAVPAIAAQAITNTGGEPDGGSGRAQDAGIPPARTPEGGRLRLGREPLFAGNPRCTIAIRPSRQVGSRHHSGPITAARASDV